MLRFKLHRFIALGLIASSILVASSRVDAKDTTSTDLLKKAKDLVAQEKCDEALVYLKSLIRKEPKNAEAYIERSRVYGKLRQFDKAFKDCDRAIAIVPNSARAYSNRASINLEDDRTWSALRDSNKAIELDPKLASAYATRALVYEREKDDQRMVEECSKAIALQQSPEVYLYRATALERLERYSEALQDCNKALALAPPSKSFANEIHVQRGRLYLGMRKAQNAIDECTVIIKNCPSEVRAYSIRADAYALLGRRQSQIDDLTAAIKLKPKDIDFYHRRSHLYHTQWQLDRAIDDSKAMLKLGATWSCPYDTAASAYEELGLLDKSLEIRTIGLESGTEQDPFSWSRRAQVHELLGNIDMAEADRKQAMAIASPEDRLRMQLCNPLIDFENPSGESSRGYIFNRIENTSIVLPFSYDDGYHICVPAKVNGHSVRLMLDTGCSHSDLWKHAMPGIAVAGPVKLKGTMANGTSYEYGFFKAREFKMGDLALPNVSLAEQTGLEGHKSLSGFLGGNILENFVVQIDYTKHKVVLFTEFDQSRTSNAIIIPIKMRTHRPYCNVILNGKLNLMALIDTGCPYSMSADSLLKPILIGKLDYNYRISGPWLGNLSSAKVLLNSVEIGGAKSGSLLIDVFPEAQASSATSEMVLGNDFLRKFKSVTFDFPGRRLILER